MTKIYYRISDLTVKLDCKEKRIFLAVHNELRPYSTAKTHQADASIEITPDKRITLPAKAVCTGHWPEYDEQRFLLNNIIYYRCGRKALFIKNYKKNKLSIRYTFLDQRVLRHTFAAIKWLITKSAENNGHAFIHGAAVRYRGKNIIFAGHPGYGKSSCLLRLNQAGAQVISDDTVLIRGTKLSPLFFDLSVKGDLRQRFRLDRSGEKPRIGENRLLRKHLRGVNIIFFPHIWHHPASRITPLSAKNALSRLKEIYLKETSWNAYPAKEKVYETKYRLILARARCFDFFAGYREKNARKCLLDFIKHS